MRLLPMLVVTTMFLAPAAQAQRRDTSPAEKQALVRRMLEVTRTRENMLAAMEATVPVQRASNPGIPAEFWDRFVVKLRERSGVLIDSIIPVYDRQFSTDDLRQLIAFYETPLGQRLVRSVPRVNAEAMEIGQRWGAGIGQEVAQDLIKDGLIPLQNQAGDDPERWAEGMSAADSSVFRLAEGTWDWSGGDSTCTSGRRHAISFSPDFREMRIRFAVPDSGRDSVYRYRVLGVGDNVVPGWNRVIRGAMEGETRMTENGSLAVWDLVLMSPNKYHWHRTDWAQGGITGAVVRCEGSKPLEK